MVDFLLFLNFFSVLFLFIYFSWDLIFFLFMIFGKGFWQ